MYAIIVSKPESGDLSPASVSYTAGISICTYLSINLSIYLIIIEHRTFEIIIAIFPASNNDREGHRVYKNRITKCLWTSFDCWKLKFYTNI